MTERVEVLIVVIRQMHAHLASLNDIEEIAESVMEDLHFTEEEKELIKKEIR